MISFITALAPGHSHVTAYISKRNQLPPIPPWRVHLMGEEKDLQELANEHSLGRTRLLHLEENYFLESDILNSLSDPNQVFKKANEILQLILGLARLRRFTASRVKAVSVLWTDVNGNWVCRMVVASEEVWSVPAIRYLEGPDVNAASPSSPDWHRGFLL
jgi:hypothetical protein